MAKTSASDKRKADAAVGANKRPRLNFEEAITLNVGTIALGKKLFVVHKDVVAQRSSKFNNVLPGAQIAIEEDWVPTQAYLEWLYRGSCEILEIADTIRSRYKWLSHDFKSEKSEQNTVVCIFTLFELWFVGHAMEDTGFCNIVMDAICRQTVADNMVIFMSSKSFSCVMPPKFRKAQSYANVKGPARWLIDRMAQSGDADELWRVMNDQSVIPVSKAIMERIVHLQKSATTSKPSLGKIDPEDYYLTQ